MGWEKRVKGVSLLAPMKKGSMSRPAILKSTKRGDDSSKTCSDIVPYEGGLPPIGNIVLKGSPPPSTRTRSSRWPIIGKPKPSAPRSSTDASPSSITCGNKRKTSPPPSTTTTERRSKHKEDTSATYPILLDEPELEADLEPLFVYNPMSEKVTVAMGTPMEGFFDGADIMVEAMSSASATTQGALVDALIPSPKPSPVEQSA